MKDVIIKTRYTLNIRFNCYKEMKHYRSQTRSQLVVYEIITSHLIIFHLYMFS